LVGNQTEHELTVTLQVDGANQTVTLAPYSLNTVVLR